MVLRREFALTLAAMLVAQRQSWAAPAAMRLVVPYPAGGVMDAAGRLVAPYVQGAFGQQVLVDNVPGAGGAIGLHQLAATPPRGATLALGTDSDTILVPLATPSAGDIPGLIRLTAVLGSGPMALFAGRDASKVQGALQTSATGEGFTCGNFGIESNSHLLALELQKRIKKSIVHVPYKGVAPVIQDLAGGQIDSAFLPLAGLQSHLEGGRITVLGVCAPSRLPRMAKTPTMNELLGATDFVYESWSGLFVPRAASEEFARRANTAVLTALDDQPFRAAMEKMGVTLAPTMTLSESEHYFQRAVEVAKTLRRGREIL